MTEKSQNTSNPCKRQGKAIQRIADHQILTLKGLHDNDGNASQKGREIPVCKKSKKTSDWAGISESLNFQKLKDCCERQKFCNLSNNMTECCTIFAAILPFVTALFAGSMKSRIQGMPPGRAAGFSYPLFPYSCRFPQERV